jgi:hypothetical protein
MEYFLVVIRPTVERCFLDKRKLLEFWLRQSIEIDVEVCN